jgi:hypothetical protein
MLVNSAFIVGMTGNLSYESKLFVQLALPCFMTFWNRTMDVLITMVFRGQHESPYRLFYGILVFNLIFAPIITSLFVDTSCFYYIFEREDEIQSNVAVPVCDSLLLTAEGCAGYLIVNFNVRFRPIFQYYFMCTSSIMSRYIPSLMLYFFGNCTVVPLLKYLLVQKFTETNIGWLMSFFPKWIQDLVPHYLWGQIIDENHKHEFPSARMLATTHANVAVLLTFGLLYPPLAVVIGATVAVQSSLHLALAMLMIVKWKELRGNFMSVMSFHHEVA